MREKLRVALEEVAGKTEFEIRRHAPKEFSARGEYSSNIAFTLAAKIKNGPAWSTPEHSRPQEIADELAAKISLPGMSCISAKGFLNFRMNDETLFSSINRAIAEGARYGANSSLVGKRINLEFVSADPTGPLHLAHGRIAVAGDALFRMLEFSGADVTREYFLNDIENSSKMRLLGESVAARYNRIFGRDEEMPEGALDDEFTRNVASQIAAREGNSFLLRPDAERVSGFAHAAREAAVESQKQTLSALGVAFDVWTSESRLIGDGRIAATLARLQNAGHVLEKNGALWLQTSAFGDEADRPLRRANGEWTYLASDIAYHAYRFERGFDLLLNIWTAQHEPYLSRTRAALLAANYPADNLEVLICENTHLTRDGARVEDSFLLDDALEEINAQTLRFLFLMPNWNQAARIEMETARRDDETNPAYAAQLLPSRLQTLLRQTQAISDQHSANSEEWNEVERQLARFIALWPDEIEAATRERRPQRVANFVLEMAAAARELLAQSRPAWSTPEPLLRAAHIVAHNALGVLGMKARDDF